VKSSETPVGPGPNHFSDDPSDVSVDAQGYLHMHISNRGGVWRSTEVICTDTLQYGTYSLTIESPITALDKNVVFGFFTWDTEAPQYAYRELDVEISMWGNDGAQNAQYAVQPWAVEGNRHRFDLGGTGAGSTHRIDWRPGRVQFSSIDAQGTPLQSWTYANTAYVPPAGAGNAHINLWLYKGQAPSDGREVEVVLKSFSFEATGSG
jgi:hypothetical protein